MVATPKFKFSNKLVQIYIYFILTPHTNRIRSGLCWVFTLLKGGEVTLDEHACKLLNETPFETLACEGGV